MRLDTQSTAPSSSHTCASPWGRGGGGCPGVEKNCKRKCYQKPAAVKRACIMKGAAVLQLHTHRLFAPIRDSSKKLSLANSLTTFMCQLLTLFFGRTFSSCQIIEKMQSVIVDSHAKKREEKGGMGVNRRGLK